MVAAVAAEPGLSVSDADTDYEFDFNIDDLFAEDVATAAEDGEQSDRPDDAQAAPGSFIEAIAAANPVGDVLAATTAVCEEEQQATSIDNPAAIDQAATSPVASVSPTSTEPPQKSIYQRIWETEHDLSNICREEERLKALLKSVKASRVETVERLETLLDQRDNPRPESESGSSSVSAETSYTKTVVGVVPKSVPQQPSDWGKDPIEVLSKYGMTEKKLEALRAAADGGRFDGTIRGLRDWIGKYDLWYRDVKGCGASGADKISDALMKYVAANPMAEEPLTAEDEAKHVAAAEFLGHTSAKAEAAEPATSEDAASIKVEQASGEIADVPLDFLETKPESQEQQPAVEAEPTKPDRKKRSKQPAAAEPADDLDDEPGPTQFKHSAGAEGAVVDEEDAYLAGCEAGAAGASCSENPYSDRSSPQAKEWQRGWEECSE